MIIRKTTVNDLDRVMKLYDFGRQYMRDNGNHNQWINGYPNEKIILDDIINENSYVCEDTDKGAERILCVFTLIMAEEPTYCKIYEGQWLNEEKYGVVHRITSDSHKHGVASYCLDWCLKQCGNLKIDTHEDNIPMQKMLKKNGFSSCGIIYINDGSKRIAYQKIDLPVKTAEEGENRKWNTHLYQKAFAQHR